MRTEPLHYQVWGQKPHTNYFLAINIFKIAFSLFCSVICKGNLSKSRMNLSQVLEKVEEEQLFDNLKISVNVL